MAKVYPDNLQSVRVLMKCNGREGEVLKSVELRGGAGERGDLYCVSIFPSFEFGAVFDW